MAQENSDMSTKFSTLNVNAAEFVPSFGSFSAAVVSSINNDNSAPAAATIAAPMDTTSVPASTSGTPATTPNSDASASGSLNALSQAAAGEVAPAESPMQTSPVKVAAPVENINTADKIAANNGNIFFWNEIRNPMRGGLCGGYLLKHSWVVLWG